MKRLFYRFDGEVIPDVTRDDLIRLVVGMQWQAMCSLFYTHLNVTSWRCPSDMWEFRPACDIVDEWLGVRK